MLAKWGRKNKGTAQASKPERISNRLDRKLIAESRKLPKWKKRILLIIGAVFLVALVAVYVQASRYKPEPAKRPQTEDPLQNEEPDWGQYFHYKTKDQR